MNERIFSLVSNVICYTIWAYNDIKIKSLAVQMYSIFLECFSAFPDQQPTYKHSIYICAINIRVIKPLRSCVSCRNLVDISPACSLSLKGFASLETLWTSVPRSLDQLSLAFPQRWHRHTYALIHTRSPARSPTHSHYY
jgi:hypothetical protein